MQPLDMVPALHHLLIIRELQRVADGLTDRLVIMLPPGSAKSTYGSMVFPPWLLSTATGIDIIGAAYNNEHAVFLSGRALAIAAEHQDVLGYTLEKSSASYWTTSNRGQYRAAGIGGGITGRRADVLIVDDPHKGREEAENPKERDKVWQWFRGDALPRLKPNGRIVVILTHWHDDDLAGRLIANQPGRWRVLKVPAIAEDLADPLGRQPGESIWPEYWPLDFLAQRETDVGPREWAALYQQRPVPLTGAFFDTNMIGRAPAIPANSILVRAWDLAASEATQGSDPDWTVGALLARTPEGRFIIGDIIRMRGNPHQVESLVRATAVRDTKRTVIALAQDPGQAGKAQVGYLTRKLAGWQVVSTPETGAKVTRATPFSAQVAAGNVDILDGTTWTVPLTDELALFPFGKHDDQVDALVRAFNTMTETKGRMSISDKLLSQFR